MSSISAVVIARNEERNIAECLARLAFADEIVVLDSGSTDRTVEIARSLGAKVSARPFDDYASQKNHAVGLAAHPWVLSVDADERVSARLAAEVREAAGRKGPAAYRILRRTRLFGREMRFGGLQHDAPIRLFLKDKARFKGQVHEEVAVDGAVGRLRETLEHRSFQTAREYWDRLQRYTTLEARQAAASEAGPRECWARPAGRFIKMYFWERGFLDGAEGFAFAALSAYYEFVRWCKIREKSL